MNRMMKFVRKRETESNKMRTIRRRKNQKKIRMKF